jgi:hypothetical protein
MRCIIVRGQNALGCAARTQPGFQKWNMPETRTSESWSLTPVTVFLHHCKQLLDIRIRNERSRDPVVDQTGRHFDRPYARPKLRHHFPGSPPYPCETWQQRASGLLHQALHLRFPEFVATYDARVGNRNRCLQRGRWSRGLAILQDRPPRIGLLSFRNASRAGI